MIISGYIKEWCNHNLQHRFFALTFTNHTHFQQHLVNIRGLNGEVEHVLSVKQNDGQKILDQFKIQEEVLEESGYVSIYSRTLDHIDISTDGMIKLADLIKIATNDNGSIIEIIKLIKSGYRPIPEYENFGAWS